ncbi:restriction endonuclease subunit S [Nitrospira sp. T9]|uniref:restriction endonuclease subunit S n=1 Tax=unclassified Nitrospira TaxID=2652172 RepID=UPI003F9BB351
MNSPANKSHTENDVSSLANELEAWSTSVDEIFKNSDIRLDATHFNPKAAGTLKKLKDSGVKLSPLSEWARVELRGQFTRIWAEDAEHGIPYLNATDLLSLLALGVPAGGMRYLSHATETNVDALLIREGWLLMTCSGTIGRVFYVPKRLNGWASTHDLIRIIPKDGGLIGYLLAWLSTPDAQSQIFSHTHGGQIDHVTDDQVAEVLVPSLPKKKMEEIHQRMMVALLDREKAIETLNNAWPDS